MTKRESANYYGSFTLHDSHCDSVSDPDSFPNAFQWEGTVIGKGMGTQFILKSHRESESDSESRNVNKPFVYVPANMTM